MSAQAFPSKLFRREAVAASAARHLGRMRVSRAPAGRTAAAAACATLALTALAAFSIRIASTVTVEGILLPTGGIVMIRAPRDGVVSTLAVSMGQAVSRGQPLFRVADQLHAPADESDLERQLGLVEEEIRLLAESERLETASVRRALVSLAAEVGMLDRQLEAAKHEYAERQRVSALRHRQAARAAKLGNALLAAQRVDDEAARAAEAGGREAAALQRILELDRARLVAGRALRLERDESDAIQNRIARRRAALERERLALLRRISVPATSPDGGIVAALMIRAGSTVRAGEHVASVVDPDEPLDAFLYFDTDAAVSIEPGQVVDLEFAGWPAEIHGTLPVRVTALAGAPIPAASLATPIAARGMVFEVRAEMLPDSPLAPVLRAGNTFRARVIESRQPLYRWVAARISGRT